MTAMAGDGRTQRIRRRRGLRAGLAGAMLASCLAAGPAAAIDPPYEDQLSRLSEILGALHYLRELCGGDEGQLWREQMEGLIAAEEPDPDRRAKLVDQFNRGYSSFAAVYRNCTPAAATVVEQYTREGARIARDITARYGR